MGIPVLCKTIMRSGKVLMVRSVFRGRASLTGFSASIILAELWLTFALTGATSLRAASDMLQ